jgi:glycoside/pentoside/hexuronide:cation symporter, GPH family
MPAAASTAQRPGDQQTEGDADAWQGGWRQGLKYGALGLPLAFVALPLYVVLPNHYASAYGIPLATLGALLLAARLLDAFADPLIGRLAAGLRILRGAF